MRIGFWRVQEIKHDQTIQFAEISIVQMSCLAYLKSLVAIISLSIILWIYSQDKESNRSRLLRSILSSTSKTSDMSESSTNSCRELKALPLDDSSGAVSAYVLTTFITFLLVRGMETLVGHLLCLILKI